MYSMVLRYNTTMDTAEVVRFAEYVYFEKVENLLTENYLEAEATEIAKARELLLYLRDVYLS